MAATRTAPSQLRLDVNAQTGTSYTIPEDDRGKLLTFSNASAIAVTLPQAGASSQFQLGWFAWVQNRGAGTLTITPATSTIDGAATLALTTNQGVLIFSDGSNYFVHRGMASAATSYYQTVKKDGTAQTQRGKLDLKAGTGVTLASVDNSAGDTTEITISANGPTVSPTYRTPTVVNQSASANSLSCSFPAGSAAGDLALIFWISTSGGANTPSTPSGWSVQIGPIIAAPQQALFYKILTSADITAGSVTVNNSGTAEIAMILRVCIGAPTIRESPSTNSSGGGSTTLTTSSAVTAGDAAIYFAGIYGSSSVSSSRGSLTASSTSGPTRSWIWDEAVTSSGALSNTFTWGSGGRWGCILILQGVVSSVGSVSSIALTVPSRQSVSGSPVTGSGGTLAITDNNQNANQVFAGPASGGAAAPSFRSLVSADFPSALSNPMNTKGDLIYGDTGGTPARLAPGTSGQVLQSNGSGAAPSWVAASGGGGAMTQIAQVVAASGATTISFSSIPGTFTNLVLQLLARSTTAVQSDFIVIQFNSDTGANYNSLAGYTVNGSTGQSQSLATASPTIAIATGASAPTGEAAGYTINIPGYSQTTFNKNAHAEGGYRDATSGNRPVMFYMWAGWVNTAAITSITLKLNTSGNAFVAGSVFTLYGQS